MKLWNWESCEVSVGGRTRWASVNIMCEGSSLEIASANNNTLFCTCVYFAFIVLSFTTLCDCVTLSAFFRVWKTSERSHAVECLILLGSTGERGRPRMTGSKTPVWQPACHCSVGGCLFNLTTVSQPESSSLCCPVVRKINSTCTFGSFPMKLSSQNNV